MTTTELDRTLEAAKLALAQTKRTVADIVRAVHSAEELQTTVYPVTLPQEIVLTKEEIVALSVLPLHISATVLPDERVELDEVQLTEITNLVGMAKKVKAIAERVVDNAKPAMFNHMDVTAEDDGRADENTPRSKDGYYLFADTTSAAVKGLDYKITREMTKGRVTLTVADLEALETKGIITHPEFLKLTKQVRVIDESSFLEVLAKKPELAVKVGKELKVGAPTLSLHIRDNKD
jgi:hypothetical protein